MAGPEEYTGVRPPLPGSFIQPLVGFQIGDRLASLPSLYHQGTQQARERELQQPVIDPATGQPTTDMTQILREANRRGGLEYAVKLLPFLQQQEMQQRAMDTFGAGYGPPPATGQRSEAPPPPNTGTALSPDSGAADTVRSVATETFPNRDVSLAIPRYASQIGVGPDDPLTPQQVRQLRARMGGDRASVPSDNAPGRVGGSEMNQPARTSSAAEASANAVQGGYGAPQPSNSGVSGSPGPIATPPANTAKVPVGPGAPTQAAEPAAGGGNLTPRPQRTASAVPGMGGGPALPAPPAGPQVAQAGPLPPRAPVMPAANDPAASLVPPGFRARGWDSQKYADFLLAQATGMVDPKRAEPLIKRAEQILAVNKAAAEQTPEIKNALASGAGTPLQYEREKVAGAKAAEQYQKLDAGIQALANTTVSSGMLDTLDEARALMDAGTATGWGAEWRRQAQQFAVQFKLADPNAAFQLEAFNKQMAGFINQQMNTLKAQAEEMGATSSRIFMQNVENMSKAAPSDLNTPAGNRFLIESYRRSAERSIQMGNMANAYKAQHNDHLDANFETQMRQWFRENPMMSEAEKKDPRLFAPPMYANIAQARAGGAQPGSPVRLPNGDIKMMPREGTQPRAQPQPQSQQM